jgi:amino acid adenylation domain-containing protein
MSDKADMSAGRPTLSAAKRALLEKRLRGKASSQPGTITPRRADGPAPLSYAQQRLWVLQQLTPESAAYNMPLRVRLRGPCHTTALERSINEIVRRHEVLRSVFPRAAGEPVAVVQPFTPVPLTIIDLSSALDPMAESVRLATLDGQRPFDLAEGPLLRTTLLRLAADDHVLLLTLHHIASDGWSLGVLTRELTALYETFAREAPSPLPELALQYSDFAHWQRQWLSGEVLERQLAYWRKALAGVEPLQLPTDRKRPASPSHRGAATHRLLPAAVSADVRSFASAQGVTLFMAMVAAFQALLSRYSGQRDVTVGTVVANRSRTELEGLIGFFVNTIVLRSDFNDEPSFRQLVQRVQENSLAALSHQDVPFEKLVEELRPDRDLGLNPLFQVIFAFHAGSADAELRLPDVVVAPFEAPVTTTRFDLELHVFDRPDGVGLMACYSTDLFERASMDRLLGHYETLLGGATARPDAPVAGVSLLAADEREQLVAGWNATGQPLPPIPVHEIVETQAAAAPNALAVASAGRRLTYGELDRVANQLAHRLRRRGVGPEVQVAVLLERSVDMVVALLAVFKSGGAYIPLDPAYPDERLMFMVRNAGAPLLVTTSDFLERLPELASAALCLDRDRESIAHEPVERLAGGATLANLAYVIYTSGSTGTPKGVQIPHAGLLNLVSWHRRVYGLSSDDRGTQLASPAFDASVWEIWPYLASGASVHIPDEGTRLAAPRLLEWLGRETITCSFLPTPLAEAALDLEWPAGGLRAVLTGGDKLHRRPRHGVPIRLINHYGPTENSVVTTCAAVDPSEHDETLPSIGKPIDNTRVYVLDERMQPVPAGVPGELFVGGVGLSRGYVNRPDLTAERFVPDPLSAEPGGRLYRTGDLVRYRADGNIEFLGRIDHQVKIRGFRIELGEIEAALARHAAVGGAAVILYEDDGERRLVGYVVARDGVEISWDELRGFLRGSLPDYMVPAAFVALDALPLTANGKLDRRALPAPKTERQIETASVEPRSPLEQQIAAIWKEVLGFAEVGVEDNFFDLGGYSLLLVQVHERLCTLLERDLPVIRLFQYPTIASLAAHIAGAGAPPETVSDATRRRIERRAARPRADGAIAIVGMAGRFPGSPDLDAFWMNLRDGVEGIRAFSDAELRDAGVPEELVRHPEYIRARGTLDGVELFDAAFFGYNPRDAELIDPQQRVFLECASEALDRAACDPDRFDGAIGVFAGSSVNSYLFHLIAQPEALASVGGVQTVVAGAADFLATRVSYKLNLHGPSVNVQTACSTSLVAIHQACRSLVDGECDLALAGGVSIHVPTVSGMLHQEGGILSPDGHCRAFDAEARGTVSGSGVGIVVLKRLDDAIAGGDTVHAIIRGTAINNDGSAKVGYTAPSVDGQAEVIALAQAAAGIEPAAVSYVEAHGTGTALGDPIEISALTRVFGRGAGPSTCAIGSLKTNIGHLDAAAGVASVIKTALALSHRELPPSLHFETPNPKIDFSAGPFRVNARLTRWESGGRPLLAGVSSFGIGGTNAHAILEEAPAPVVSGPSRPWQVLGLSAKTRGALDAAAANLAAWLSDHADAPLADVAYTLQIGRRQFAHRRAVVCRDTGEAVRLLSQPDRVKAPPADAADSGCVFLFSGQGAQYAGMARDLYRDEPSFHADVDACCEILVPHLGCDLRDVLYAADDRGASRLDETQFTQPALFVVEYALARLWMRWGITPSGMLGHSLGEYVAACLAGVFSLEDALRLVAARGRLMQAMAPGAMIAVALPETELQPLIDDRVSIAAVNAPSMSVAAGPFEAIGDLEAGLSARGVFVRRLRTSHAFHSAMMEPALERYRAEFERVTLSRPSIPFVSNVTGTWIAADQATSPDYWVRHLRSAVRFADGVRTLVGASTRVVLEVGPGATLAGLAKSQISAGAGAMVLASTRAADAPGSDHAFILGTLGQMWRAGLAIDWQAFSAGERRRKLPLPTYPFERKRYWIDVQKRAVGIESTLTRSNLADWFYVPAWRAITRNEVGSGALPRRWLVFADQRGVAARIVDYLGRQSCDVTVVVAGNQFARQREDRFVIDPQRRDDYDALLQQLNAAGRLPERIAHLWSVDDAEASELQWRGFFSLLFIAQASGAIGATAPIDLTVLTAGVQQVESHDVLTPGKATVLGPIRVIPDEYPHISCRTVDVVVEELIAADADAVARFVRRIAVDDRAAGVKMIAVRGGQWLAPTLEPVRFDAGAERPSRLRERGTYLITGGTGGIGLTLAGYLARTVQARLVLTSRRGLPDRGEWGAYVSRAGEDDRVSRQIRSVEALERDGADVIVLAADIADAGQISAAVAEAARRFGRLHGVIHSAGVAGGGVIQLKTVEAAERVLAPKVRGTIALADALAGTPLDFFVLCSSLTSMIGGAGQVDYCAANAYLDAFAREYGRRTGTFTVAVNWDAWQQVGMAVETAVPAQAEREHATILARGIAPDEGAEAFARILRHAPAGQVAVSTVSFAARIEQLQRARRTADAPRAIEQTAAPAASHAYARPELATVYVAPLGEVERAIADVWRRLLGIDEIGRDDNFFDLGGHSLLLIQAHEALNEKLGRTLPLTDLFQFPTIGSLAEHVAGLRAPAVTEAVAVQRAPADTDSAIAIIGMAGRFPGARDLDAFWANLRAGVESIRPVSDDTLRQQGVPEEVLRHPRYVKAASVVDDVEMFDAGFFGYSPREAELLDPQQRLFLECAWEALERAGYDPKQYRGHVGVYAGASFNQYFANIFSHSDLVQKVGPMQAGLGSRADLLPTRVSYKLNLRGPSINVQTACSTSLVAVHQACLSLLHGESDMALAGGASISVGMPRPVGYFYQDEGIVSPDGHCRAFDAAARGTVWGDGVGIVLLKRLADAIADGDTIHAVIRGTAVNNDGSVKVGFTAPSVEGQAAVIARAHAAAGIEPASISYIEAHGTGTTLGDPIEVAALSEVFGAAAPASCAIGTVKSNLGHLDAAAGVAGLIKTTLALAHREIPPSLHFEQPNPKIDFAQCPFFVNATLRPWASNGGPRRAGVSAFGIGGTNAHVVLEEAPPAVPSGPSRPWQLLVLSARTPTALDRAAWDLATHLESHPEDALADVAHTLRVGRRGFPYRRMLVCRDAADAIRQLRATEA